MPENTFELPALPECGMRLLDGFAVEVIRRQVIRMPLLDRCAASSPTHNADGYTWVGFLIGGDESGSAVHALRFPGF